MSIERLPNSGGATYSDAGAVDAQGGRWILVPGQLPLDDDGDVVRTDIGTQTAACFAGIQHDLERAGGVQTDLVCTTADLTSLDGYRDYASARGQWFSDALPAKHNGQDDRTDRWRCRSKWMLSHLSHDVSAYRRT